MALPRYVLRLTATELRLLRLLAKERLTLAELAQALGCSRSTAKNHVNRIATKLPGDLPALLRVTLWARGTPAEHLYWPAPTLLHDHRVVDQYGVVTDVVLQP